MLSTIDHHCKVIIEQLWLTYYNDTLYSKGLITEEERNKVRTIIKRRAIRPPRS